jgi:CRISPR-associated endonuclease Cas3-HD
MKGQDNVYYAHSKEGEPLDNWQPLEEHLRNVAKLAGDFAGVFGAMQWGYIAGLWHDIGKYSSDFQEMLYLISEETYKVCLNIGKNNHD